jgi:myo-inositol-1(or 4)-monophosphatase
MSPADPFADPPSAVELEQLAVELALGAAGVVRDGSGATMSVGAKSTATDLVTEVDRASERWLVEQLGARRPHDAILGEEGGVRPGTSRVRWVVDPIDGTVNFALGLPNYAVSVAVEVDGRVLAGCVHNPSSGEVYHARHGHGAYLDRDLDGADEPETDTRTLGATVTRHARRLTGPRQVDLDRAVIGTGFSYDPADRARQGAVIARLLAKIGDIRRFGAASLDLCAVAAGRLDGFFEAGLNEWDYAAGLLIAAEAGCAVSGLRGRPASGRFTAAAGAGLGPDLFELLESLDADLPPADNT